MTTPPIQSIDLPSYPSLELIEAPYGFFEQARRIAPVLPSQKPNEYLVFRHSDIVHVLRHPELFSELIPELNRFDRGTEVLIASLGPPRHKAVRAHSSRPFTPGRLREANAIVERIVDRLIDGFADRGEVELMNDFALPLPAYLMTELMGLPQEGEDFELLRTHWARAVGYGDFTTDPETADRLAVRLGDFFERELRKRRDDPTDDILTELLRTQVERDGDLNIDHLTVIATELFVGGAGTTALMIVNAMWLLLEHPEELAKVQGDFSLIPAMLEEALRVESVVQERERIAIIDTELAGVPIPEGARLRLVLAAGNRDPEVFSDPDLFVVGRPHSELKQHLAFGSGIHSCLGAPLARIEGRIAFERLFMRLDDIRLAPGNDFTHMFSTRFRALKALHLAFKCR